MLFYMLPKDQIPEGLTYIGVDCRGSVLIGTLHQIDGQSVLTEDELRSICYRNRLNYDEVTLWNIVYSITGNLSTSDIQAVEDILLEYANTHYISNSYTDEFDGIQKFSFEVWLDSVDDKTNLFNQLKPLVDIYGEFIAWHECTHDSQYPKPCVIAETYKKVGV